MKNIKIILLRLMHKAGLVVANYITSNRQNDKELIEISNALAELEKKIMAYMPQ